MKKFITFSLLAFLLGIFSSNLFAQAGTGKLAGKIVDAETGEALIGANVVILNTSLGAAADLDGRYFILNITPGTYDVQISFVGYSSKLIKEVRIVAGITYELNESLSAGIEMEEIVVTDQKFFEEKATNTVKVVDSETINRLPVRGVENFAALQAGVVKSDGSGGAAGNAEINVRGGRGGEVVFVVDGVVQNDQMWGTNYSQVSNAAVDQISFQVGGYEAKYGQAQSGIVSVTTKSGSPKYTVFGDVLTSSFTDDYGFNLYTLSVGGPILPGNASHTFFVSAERGWFLDGDPKALNNSFPSIGVDNPINPNNNDAVWRMTARTFHDIGNQFNIQLGFNYNDREYRRLAPYFVGQTGYEFAKSNSVHNPRQLSENISASFKLSKNIGSSSFWNLIVGFQSLDFKEGDGVFFDDWEAYGDTLKNPFIPVQADDSALEKDDVGIFAQYGKVDDYFRKFENQKFTGDFNFTSQVGDHLLEGGVGGFLGQLRYYRITPISLAKYVRDYISPSGDTIAAMSRLDRFEREEPYRYGYDIFGDKNESAEDIDSDPKKPIIAYGYIQDRFELDDLVLNLGVRFDYFDSKTDVVIDPENPYSGGSDPKAFDPGDFKTKDPEFHISPRIGIGFPVTETTVFHAQYGRFVQEPRLIDLYSITSRMDLLRQTSDFSLSTGYIESEITTQYEVGFRQILGNNAAALNITAFYKNTQGLANQGVQDYYRTPGGERLQYYTPTNQDFGTVKGLAFSLNVQRISYFSISIDYTFSLAEGTGSTTNSSYVAAFRNDPPEVPKVIAPLEFDQRHTGIAIIDFYVPKGEFGFFEQFNANFLISFSSGRPYTPLETQNLLNGFTNWGNTKGYINSAFGPGNFRVDLKLEKAFSLGGATTITPYLWIENLFDSDNPTQVWRSTGDPYSTGYLSTEEGKKLARQNGEAWVQDYESLERDPANFGIPRLIKLGLKVNFAGL